MHKKGVVDGMQWIVSLSYHLTKTSDAAMTLLPCIRKGLRLPGWSRIRPVSSILPGIFFFEVDCRTTEQAVRRQWLTPSIDT